MAVPPLPAPLSSLGPSPKSAECEPGFAVPVFLALDSVSEEEEVLVVGGTWLMVSVASWEARADFISDGFEGLGLLILLAGVVLDGRRGSVVVVLDMSAGPPELCICSGSLPRSWGASGVPFPGGAPAGASVPGWVGTCSGMWPGWWGVSIVAFPGVSPAGASAVVCVVGAVSPKTEFLAAAVMLAMVSIVRSWCGL